MSRSLRIVLALAIVVSFALALAGGLLSHPGGGDQHALRARRIVVFTIPGVTWNDVLETAGRRFPEEEPARDFEVEGRPPQGLPTFARLVREGATAALAPRTASVRPSATRGYLTLGAGNRAAAPNVIEEAERAYEKDEEVYEGVSADNALVAELGRAHKAAVVHLGVAELQARQEPEYHGAVVGALGEALRKAGVTRGVVSASDRARAGVPPETGRGAPVLAIVDTAGGVDRGKIRGLVDPAVGGADPFGVYTDGTALVRAVELTLDKVRVLFVEPGTTLRADQFSSEAFEDAARKHREDALRKTDAILAVMTRILSPEDLLLVVGSSSPERSEQEHLTPVIAWGEGVNPGELISATTHRPGIVTLTDVAPTVLDAVAVPRPPSMSGRPFRQIDSSAERPRAHAQLDDESVFRERVVPTVFYSFVTLFVILFLLVALVFLFRLPFEAPLVGVCYLILALPLATFVLTIVPLWRVGEPATHVAIWTMAIVIAGAGWLVPGPRWTGAIPLLLATVTFIGTILLTGGHLLVNAVFGNSVLAAGRFYGIPNTGSALFFGAGVLSLAGLAELWPAARSRLAIAAGMGVILVLTGLPSFGADVGGLLTGFASAVVILFSARGERIAWKRVVFALLAAAAVTLLVAYVDSLRSPDQQTHLGRFADELLSGGGTALTTVTRKATQSWASLSFSRFTYVVPLGIAALAVLLRRPRGPLRDVLLTHRVFRAGLAALMIAGVLGFAVNDSGVAVPALLLAQAVPVFVLLALDHVRMRSGFELDG